MRPLFVAARMLPSPQEIMARIVVTCASPRLLPSSFDPRLMERERLIVGSKVDAVCEERRRELKAAAADAGQPYLEISSVSGAGVKELKAELFSRLEQERSE